MAAVILIVGGGNTAPVWIGTAMMGLATAPQFPGMMNLAERRIHISGSATAWFVGGAGAGGLVFPFLIGSWFDAEWRDRSAVGRVRARAGDLRRLRRRQSGPRTHAGHTWSDLAGGCQQPRLELGAERIRRSAPDPLSLRSWSGFAYRLALLVPRPASRALAIAAARSATPSLVSTLDRWLRTVLSLNDRRCGDATVVEPFGDQLEHLALAVGERRERVGTAASLAR